MVVELNRQGPLAVVPAEAPLPFDLDSLNYNGLRAKARELGLSAGGHKLELMERIVKFLQPRTSLALLPAAIDQTVGSISFVSQDTSLSRTVGAMTYRAFAQTPWVFSGIKIIKDQVSSADWDIVPVDHTKRFSVRLQQKIRDLFDQPSAKLDSFQSWSATLIDDLLTLDAGVVEKVRYPDGTIGELWPVRGEWIAVDERWDGTDPDRPRYFYIPDGVIRAKFKNSDMLYMIANPRTNSSVGVSPMAVLASVIDSELRAMEYNRAMVMGSPPEGVLNIGEDAPPEKVEEAKSYWESKIWGQQAMAIIGGFKNPEFLKFRATNQEMQFREWQDLLVRCIAVTLGLAPQDLGITFDVNRSTAETQSDNSADRGIRPRMALIQRYFTREIVWDESFGGRENNLQFVFKSLNLDESMAKANINKVAMPGVGWKTMNEARANAGFPPMGDPMDDNNIANHILVQTPKGMLDLTTAKYVGEEQLAQISVDAQTEIADQAAENAKEVAAAEPKPEPAAPAAKKPA